MFLKKFAKLVVLITSFFGLQAAGYLGVCAFRGDSYFQLFGIWHSTRMLMWASGLLLPVPALSGLGHLLLAMGRTSGRTYTHDILLRRWIGLQLDGVLPNDAAASRRFESPRS